MKVQLIRDDFYLYEACPFSTTAPWGVTVDWPDDLDFDDYETTRQKQRYWQNALAKLDKEMVFK